MQVDSAIYAVGGCNHEGNLTSCVKYSEERDEWETTAAMPKALRLVSKLNTIVFEKENHYNNK